MTASRLCLPNPLPLAHSAFFALHTAMAKRLNYSNAEPIGNPHLPKSARAKIIAELI